MRVGMRVIGEGEGESEDEVEVMLMGMGSTEVEGYGWKRGRGWADLQQPQRRAGRLGVDASVRGWLCR